MNEGERIIKDIEKLAEKRLGKTRRKHWGGGKPAGTKPRTPEETVRELEEDYLRIQAEKELASKKETELKLAEALNNKSPEEFKGALGEALEDFKKNKSPEEYKLALEEALKVLEKARPERRRGIMTTEEETPEEIERSLQREYEDYSQGD